ncbi:hypothetical protein GCM10028805_06050 [Spirosoma harenae]
MTNQSSESDGSENRSDNESESSAEANKDNTSSNHDTEPATETASPVANATNPLDLLKPTEGYTVTPILIWLNVGVFVLMALTGVNLLLPSGQDLIRWGANYTPLTLGEQPWRLLSCCFIHIGLIHLLFNMYALTQIGAVLEPLLRTRWFIIAYLTAGISGSVGSLWWHDITLSAGASGAIFGLYGVFLALLTTNLFDAETRSSLLKSILLFVGYNLVIGLQAGIDNAAHIGGLLAGMLFGYTVYFAAFRPNRSATSMFWPILISPVVVFILAAVVYLNTANVLGDYDRIMGKFGRLEQQAMNVFQLPPNTSAAGVAKAINDRGIPAWKQTIELLNEADKLNLPDEYQKRNKLLRQYSQLRLNSFKLLERSLTDTTHVYDQQITNYDRQIQGILKQLKTPKKQ